MCKGGRDRGMLVLQCRTALHGSSGLARGRRAGRTTVAERQVDGANVSGRKRRLGVFGLRDVSRDAQLRVR
jgi:hypothetical protein